jgi:hypothetical protein
MFRVSMRSLAAGLAALFTFAACSDSSSTYTPPAPPAPPAANVLSGGQFTTWDAGVWHFAGLPGTAAALEARKDFESSCLTVTGQSYGLATFDTQLAYWDAETSAPKLLPVLKSKKYQLKIKASASQAATLQLVLQDGSTILGKADVALTTTPTEFTSEEIRVPANGTAAVKVNFGGADNAGATFHVDDLYLLELNAAQGLDPVRGENLLTGGDFESFDQKVWNFYPNTATGGAVDCADQFFVGQCFRISSTDYGAAAYSTQLAFSDNYTAKVLNLSKARKYRLRLQAAASIAGKTFHVVLADGAGATVKDLQVGPLITTAEAYDTLEFTLDADAAVKYLVNFGPESDNAGVTFSLDNLELLEITPPVGVELLMAGDFESSPDYTIWNSWGTGNSKTIPDCSADGFTGKCVQFVSASYGTNAWDTQLVYCGGDGGAGKLLTFKAGLTYTLSFKGRATGSGAPALSVFLQNADLPFSPTFNLTGTVATYTADFVPAADTTLALKFNLGGAGNAGATIQLDDISLLEK